MEKSIFLFSRRFTLVLILFTSQIKGFQQSPTLSDSDDIGQQQQHHAKDIHCSRERSRLAWNNIEQYLMPYVETEQYEIPTKCRLHRDNDLFRDQEEHKICLDTNEWKCGYCVKAFRAEVFLDQHLHTRHYDLLNVSHSKCLADLCGALHCDYTTSSKKRKTKCNEATTAKNRHLCESLADSCFPVKKGPSASRLHELFLRQFCDAHSCLGKMKPFPRGGRKNPTLLYLSTAILTMMLLPLFYLLVFIYQREMRKGSQELRRIPRFGRKAKPS